MHGKVNRDGPKPFGWVDTHPLDGGVVPPKVVHVDPFFMDTTPVTNKQFAKFVRATYYETEAEQFGWSFVLASFLPKSEITEVDVDPEAEHWVAVNGAYWRAPEGPGRWNGTIMFLSYFQYILFCMYPHNYHLLSLYFTKAPHINFVRIIL